MYLKLCHYERDKLLHRDHIEAFGVEVCKDAGTRTITTEHQPILALYGVATVAFVANRRHFEAIMHSCRLIIKEMITSVPIQLS